MPELNFEHARENQQKDIMIKASQNNSCPFCWELVEKYHPKPILQKGKWWWISENGWPYKGTETHLIFFYRDHVSRISEIFPEAFGELQTIIKWAEDRFNIKGGALFIRFGDTNRTGSSIQHIHAQLVVGNSEKGANSEALRVKLGYKKK